MAEVDRKKVARYNKFIEEASKLIGRPLKFTTGGNSIHHKKGALDISNEKGTRHGNSFTPEEYTAIGKLALDYGYRIGDEEHHIHVDDSPKGPRVFLRRQNISKGNITFTGRYSKGNPKQLEAIKNNQFINYLKDKEKNKEEKPIQASENNMSNENIMEKLTQQDLENIKAFKKYKLTEQDNANIQKFRESKAADTGPSPEDIDWKAPKEDEFATREEFAYRDSDEFRQQAGEAYAAEKEGQKAMATSFGSSLGAYSGQELLAAVDTTKEVAGEMAEQLQKDGLAGVDVNLAEVGDRYSQHLRGREESFKDMQAKHPSYWAFGDISGVLALSALTGGTGAIFGAGKLAATKVIGINAAEGAARGWGLSEGTVLGGDKTIEDTLNDMGWGATFQAGGATVGATAGQLLHYGAEGVKSFGRWAGGKLGANSYLAVMGAHHGKQRVDAINSLLETNREVGAHSNRMVNYKIKKINYDTGEETAEYLIKPTRTAKSLKKLVDEEAEILGDEMGQQIVQVNKPIDPFKIVNKIKQTAEKRKRIYGHVKHTDDINKIILQEEGQYLKITPGQGKEALPLDLVKVDSIKRSYNKLERDRSESDVARGLYGKLAAQLGEVIDDGLRESAGHPAVANYTKLKMHYGDMKEAGKMLENKLDSMGADNTAVNVFQHYINRNTLAGFAIGKAFSMDNTDAAVVGLALGKVATNTHVNAVTAAGFTKLSNALKKSPQKYSKIAQNILAASAISPSAWEEELMLGAAMVTLSEQPLERTTNDVIRQKGSILTIMDSIDEKAGKSLRAAINAEDQNKIGSMMGAAEEYFPNMMLPGVGWDGIARTAEDQQTVLKWIKGQKSTRQRKRLMEGFQSDRKVPMEMITGEGVDESERILVYRKIRDKISRQPY